MMRYPCDNCKKERQNPGYCDDKFCPKWQNWFRLRWAYTKGLWGMELDGR